MQCDIDKEQDEIRLINEKADEEIRIINEKRERRIKAVKEEAEKQEEALRDARTKLRSQIKNIDKTVRRKMVDLKIENEHAINSMTEMDSKIERIMQDDGTLVDEGPQIIASLEVSLSSDLQEGAASVYQIEREVQEVKFVEGEVGGKHYARIDGYIGKWELDKSFDIPSIVNGPVVRGLISDDDICVLDLMDNSWYVTNISNEHTEKIMEGDTRGYKLVTTCMPLDSNVIVCGKTKNNCPANSLAGCITLYDRQWEEVRDIIIPRNNSCPTTAVIVDVDKDGMILAAEYGQSNIYVINPADGKIVNTITLLDKLVRGIQALSSGDVIAKTDGDKFIVISRSGEEKAVIHCDEWKDSRCYVDKLTDTLYITFQNGECKTYAVDQVSCDGNIQAKRILEYKQSDRCPYRSPCLVTPTGKLVACDGNKIFLYKKSYIVNS